MEYKPFNYRWRSGFTLLELSVVLAIIGVILYGSMTILVVGVQSSQVNSTIATMDAIENALLNFRVAFGRLPCPSDLTATASSASYGIEAANTGSCTSGSPAANFIATSGIAEGGVPTRALRLPDSYMYDGWGHKLRYAVNPNDTLITSAACTLSGTPSITINDASGAARSTNAVYAIISHGANGHGGYTSNGIVVNTGSTNADEQTNCHCGNTGAHTGGAGVLSPTTYVQKAPTIATAGSLLTAFDDIVTYKEVWQLMTSSLSTNSLGCIAGPYYRTITIDHTKVGTVNNTDQTNFPFLFAGTYSYLATSAHGGNAKNANGYDITFTSDAAGAHLLNFEQESYNSTTGAVNYWVQIPTVSHTTDTVIYLQYGNSSTTTNQANVTGVWGSSYNSGLGYYTGSTYQGVWHFGSGINNAGPNLANGAAPTDSTQIYQNNASYWYQYVSASSAPILSTGTSPWGSGSAIYFNNPSYNANVMDIGQQNQNDMYENLTTFTVETWVNKTAASVSDYNDWAVAACAAKTSGSGNASVNTNECTWGLATTSSLYTSPDNCPTLFVNSTSKVVSSVVSSTCPALNTWYHVAATRNGTTCTIYVNGTQTGQNTSCPSTLKNNGNGVVAGDGPDGVESEIYMDELRFSSTAYSADWIKTEYNNQSAPDKAISGSGGFYTVGAQQISR